MLMLALLALAEPTIGTSKTFGDWEVACDNIRACEMTSLMREEDEWPEEGPRTASIARAPGPQGGFVVVVDSGKASGPATLEIDGTAVARGTPTNGALRFGGADAARIVAAAAEGSKLTLSQSGAAITGVWLAGTSAALRFIDAEQGRAGTVTAAVAKGSNPAASVPAARAAPRVAALRAPGGSAAEVSATLRAQMEKVSGCDELAGQPGEGEIETIALGGGATLALLPCGSGAYNISSVPFVIRGGKAEPAEIDYAGDASNDAAMLTNAWWEAETSVLATHAKGRGIGDCGEDARYVWDGKGFRLIEMRVMSTCRGSVNWLRVWKAQPAYR